jgi:hypothetical protein
MTPAIDGAICGGHHVQIGAYYEDTDFSGIVYRANCLRFMECGIVLDPVRLPAAHPVQAAFDLARLQTSRPRRARPRSGAVRIVR